ncbi:methyltransferase [Flavicella sp.]|uniref:tRNA1(Val) (adenine(37)-N6)-methyltransferase n=1 Tax=Flavicella sp. TaxID=2957742 RepID=UPI00260701EC|nr:methyltransferase [Flavicella sp.]MDG1804512.1 methyltransferase [Flavicella sp.]MDG2279314.1 methyltransferase [Flavicella sp.]
MNKPFQFKEFTVEQDQCAMKIGTDGVLLGAWATVSDEFSILDLGTGTGVISLMMAQRSNAEIIEAVELDGPAFEQAVSNFENSDWSDRLFCYHASIQEYAQEIDDTYDLIISNPPFFTDANPSENKERATARFEDAMPFEHLTYAASKLLDPNGRFAVIIPFKEEEKFIKLAKQQSLFLNRVCRVKGTETSPIKRSLLEFSLSKKEIITETLIIEIERHVYTEAYKNLVKDFYLKM